MWRRFRPRQPEPWLAAGSGVTGRGVGARDPGGVGNGQTDRLRVLLACCRALACLWVSLCWRWLWLSHDRRPERHGGQAPAGAGGAGNTTGARATRARAARGHGRRARATGAGTGTGGTRGLGGSATAGMGGSAAAGMGGSGGGPAGQAAEPRRRRGEVPGAESDPARRGRIAALAALQEGPARRPTGGVPGRAEPRRHGGQLRHAAGRAVRAGDGARRPAGDDRPASPRSRRATAPSCSERRPPRRWSAGWRSAAA